MLGCLHLLYELKGVFLRNDNGEAFHSILVREVIQRFIISEIFSLNVDKYVSRNEEEPLFVTSKSHVHQAKNDAHDLTNPKTNLKTTLST